MVTSRFQNVVIALKLNFIIVAFFVIIDHFLLEAFSKTPLGSKTPFSLIVLPSDCSFQFPWLVLESHKITRQLLIFFSSHCLGDFIQSPSFKYHIFVDNSHINVHFPDLFSLSLHTDIYQALKFRFKNRNLDCLYYTSLFCSFSYLSKQQLHFSI